MQPDETLAMIADHLERGFLENIIDMMKHDRGLLGLLPALIADERGRVRLGTVAVVEALVESCAEEILAQAPAVLRALGDENPTVRADAAYLLCTMGARDALPYLEEARDRETVQPVREALEETIQEMKGGPGPGPDPL
ncbi:MAG: HEAT repeat domain-containing protein [Nitrospirota bacterium]|jgi:hypothetical protein